jgi:putative restriction endonuclease
MDAGRNYVAGMSQPALMTAEELLRLNLPDKRTELIRGRLVVRDPGGARHGAVAMQLGYRIMAHAEAHDLGRICGEGSGLRTYRRARGGRFEMLPRA